MNLSAGSVMSLVPTTGSVQFHIADTHGEPTAELPLLGYAVVVTDVTDTDHGLLYDTGIYPVVLAHGSPTTTYELEAEWDPKGIFQVVAP